MRHSIYPTPKEDIGVVIASMRTGSSLLGHLLHEAGAGNCIGELHVNWNGWSEGFLDTIRTKFDANREIAGIVENDTSLIIDKVVHSKRSDSGPVPFGHALKIWCLVREPITHIAALNKVNWGSSNFTYLLKNYSFVHSVAQMWINERDLKILDFYHLFNGGHRERVFGAHMRGCEKYSPTNFAGKSGWGDPSKVIRSGVLQNRHQSEDIDKALSMLPISVTRHPAIPQLYRIHNATLGLAGLPPVEMPS